VIGILVVTHGRLSEALLEAAAMLVTDKASTCAVTFTEGQGVEDLEHAVHSAIAGLASCEGLLALVDIPGGSPARAVATVLLENEGVELVTGVNLPMLVEVLMMRASLTLSELVNHAVTCGTDGIVNVGQLLRLG